MNRGMPSSRMQSGATGRAVTDGSGVFFFQAEDGIRDIGVTGVQRVLFRSVDDIISSPVVKESIINNSDCKILLDQRKYMNKFDQIQALLGLTDKERGQILSINQSNDATRSYKEVWIGLGGVQSAVYATEVSKAEYLTYTTEETEKMRVLARAEKLGGNMELAVRQLAEEE